MNFIIKPVATVKSPREEVRDDHWGQIESVIELLPEFDEEAWQGIEEFSHVEVVFIFDRVEEEKIERAARHPRNNPAWPRVGIFAQRGKNRPNRLGTTLTRLIRREGRRLIVRGLDAVDGTPVVDLKPVMAEFLPHDPIRQPEWSHELMANYW